MTAILTSVGLGALAHLEIELDADPESLPPRGDSQTWEQSGPGMGDDLAPFGLPPLGSLEDMAHMAGMDLDVLEPEPEFTNGNGGAMAPVRTRKAAATVDPRRPGARCRATRPAPADPAGITSTATAGSDACRPSSWGSVRLAAQFRLRPEKGLGSGLNSLH